VHFPVTRVAGRAWSGQATADNVWSSRRGSSFTLLKSSPHRRQYRIGGLRRVSSACWRWRRDTPSATVSPLRSLRSTRDSGAARPAQEAPTASPSGVADDGDEAIDFGELYAADAVASGQSAGDGRRPPLGSVDILTPECDDSDQLAEPVARLERPVLGERPTMRPTPWPVADPALGSSALEAHATR
jgi:hypothetical protein